MTWTIIVLVVLALVLWSFYVSWRASRLDRLHNRVEAARTALDLAMVRRASAASELASSGLLDPATSLLLADAVRRARDVGSAERDLAESDLTRALRATLGDPDFRKELAADDAASRGAASHGVLDHGALDHGALDHGALDHGALDHGALDHGALDHGALDHGALNHGALDHGAAELVAEVEAAAQQVFIARKFYNDLAGRTVYARRRPLARALRLAGSAALPAFFEMDDKIADEGIE